MLMPISLIIRLALAVVYVITFILGPKCESSMLTTSGPPARPSFTAWGMPGKAIGMLPTMTPRAMPKKIGARFGSSSLLSELPRTFSTEATDSLLPTTVTRSPYCRRKSALALRSNPALLTLVMEAPNISSNFSSSSLFPLMLFLLMSILLDMNLVSAASECLLIIADSASNSSFFRSIFSFLRSGAIILPCE